MSLGDSDTVATKRLFFLIQLSSFLSYSMQTNNQIFRLYNILLAMTLNVKI